MEGMKTNAQNKETREYEAVGSSRYYQNFTPPHKVGKLMKEQLGTVSPGYNGSNETGELLQEVENS